MADFDQAQLFNDELQSMECIGSAPPRHGPHATQQPDSASCTTLLLGRYFSSDREAAIAHDKRSRELGLRVLAYLAITNVLPRMPTQPQHVAAARLVMPDCACAMAPCRWGPQHPAQLLHATHSRRCRRGQERIIGSTDGRADGEGNPAARLGSRSAR